MSKDTGGPAFPESLSSVGPFGGMTLRDWFAGQALVGRSGHAKFVAEFAYELADAMIAERSKP